MRSSTGSRLISRDMLVKLGSRSLTSALVRGAERPVREANARNPPEALSGTQSDEVVRRRRPVPGLRAICAISTPAADLRGMLSFAGTGRLKGFQKADKRPRLNALSMTPLAPAR